LVPKLQAVAPVAETLWCITAILQHAPAEARSRVNPAPAVSVSEFWSKNSATIISSAFKVVAPVAVGVVDPPPVQRDAWAGEPEAWSKGLKVPVGSSEPANAIASPDAPAGVPLRLIVITTAERVAVVCPIHSEPVMVQEVGVEVSLAAASKVIPVAEGLFSVTVPEAATITIIVSAAVFVDIAASVKVVPLLQVPVTAELAFASFVGVEPIEIPVSTVEVEAVPELVDSPLQRVPQAPTVVLFVKKV
jgi:hypothetical protein